MNEADRRLADVAATQRQVFTREQARSAGLTYNGIRRRIDSGQFVVVGPHTLTFAGATLDWRGQLQAGLLDLGPGALVSAEAAAALHGLDGFDAYPLVYLVPRVARGRTTAGYVTSSPTIDKLDCTTVEGLVTTSGTRTIIELIGRVSPVELGNAYDSACRKRVTAPAVVKRRLDELGRRGRPGVAEFDRLLEVAGVESWLERAFLRLIRRCRLPRPQVQRTYRRDGVRVARVDFDFAPLPIVVEVGGKRARLPQRHGPPAPGASTQRAPTPRQLIYFFTTEDVTADASDVVKTLTAALGTLAS